MPWGSNLGNVTQKFYMAESDPATWASIGATRRAEEAKKAATLGVAEARKSAREKFVGGIEEKGKKAYSEQQTALKSELATVEKRLAEIGGRLQQIQNAENTQANTALKQDMRQDQWDTGEAMSGYKNVQNEVPLFGRNR